LTPIRNDFRWRLLDKRDSAISPHTTDGSEMTHFLLVAYMKWFTSICRKLGQNSTF